MLLILFLGTEFRVVFSSGVWFGTGFWEFAFFPWYRIPSIFLFRNGSEQNSESFLFRGTSGILSEQINFSVYSIFLGIIFCRKVVNPRQKNQWKFPSIESNRRSPGPRRNPFYSLKITSKLIKFNQCARLSFNLYSRYIQYSGIKFAFIYFFIYSFYWKKGWDKYIGDLPRGKKTKCLNRRKREKAIFASREARNWPPRWCLSLDHLYQ